MKNFNLKWAVVPFLLSSIHTFANTNSEQPNKVNVNLVFGTGFRAYVCTKSPNSPKICSHRLSVLQSYSFPAKKNERICVLTAGWSRHFEYYFDMNNNESGAINFWGPYFYPDYNMSNNIIFNHDKTIWEGPGATPTCSEFDYE